MKRVKRGVSVLYSYDSVTWFFLFFASHHIIIQPKRVKKWGKPASALPSLPKHLSVNALERAQAVRDAVQAQLDLRISFVEREGEGEGSRGRQGQLDRVIRCLISTVCIRTHELLFSFQHPFIFFSLFPFDGGFFISSGIYFLFFYLFSWTEEWTCVGGDRRTRTFPNDPCPKSLMTTYWLRNVLPLESLRRFTSSVCLKSPTENEPSLNEEISDDAWREPNVLPLLGVTSRTRSDIFPRVCERRRFG